MTKEQLRMLLENMEAGDPSKINPYKWGWNCVIVNTTYKIDGKAFETVGLKAAYLKGGLTVTDEQLDYLHSKMTITEDE